MCSQPIEQDAQLLRATPRISCSSSAASLGAALVGEIATETTAEELANDPAAQRRYLGVEPLPDAA